MAAFDINSPRHGVPRKLAPPRHMLSSRIFAHDVCDGFVASFSAFISFYAIGYTYILSRGYRDCMFRSEGLKDAKFRSGLHSLVTDSSH